MKLKNQGTKQEGIFGGGCNHLKWWLMVLACMVMSLCVAFPALADEYDWNGYKYTMDKGKITIIGYYGTEHNLNIPSKIDGYPVVKIAGLNGNEWAGLNGTVENIVLPDTLQEIQTGAFSSCYDLRTIRWSSGVKTIPDSCFIYCSKLVSVTNTSGVEKIGGGAFEQCGSLTSISLPKVKEVGEAAFKRCTSLEKIELPAVEEIDSAGAYSGAFFESGVVTVVLGENLREISGGTFEECTSLKNVSFSQKLEKIGWSAFYGCTSLTAIKWPSTLKTIEQRAFTGSGITSAVIPQNVEGIYYSFVETPNLKSVTIFCKTLGSGMFRNCKSLTDVTLNPGVEEIDSQAFAGCSALREITIPDSVKTIADGAFDECDRLTKIIGVFGSEAEKYAKKIGVAFEGRKPSLSSAVVKLSKTTYLYNGKACKPSVTVTYNGKVLTKNKDYKVTYGTNKNIGTGTVKVTGMGAYSGSKTVNFSIVIDTSKRYKVGKYYYKVTSASGGKVKVMAPVSKTASTAKIPATIKLYGTTYKVTAIDAKAYQKNTAIKKVILGKNITSLPAKAFYGCKKLAKLQVKSTNFKSVGKNALKGTKNKLRVEVPASKSKTYKKLFTGKGTKIKIVKK